MAAPMTSAGGPIESDPGVLQPAVEPAPKKKGRTNTPWTAEEEQRLKTMRDAGRSWSEIAKVGAPLLARRAQSVTDRRLLTRRRPFPRGPKAV